MFHKRKAPFVVKQRVSLYPAMTTSKLTKKMRLSNIVKAALVVIAFAPLIHARGLPRQQAEFWPPFTPAKIGCSMAHCDAQMSDNGHMLVPEGDVEVLWRDPEPIGAPFMIGCSSNGFIAACTFGPMGTDSFLRAYNGDGDIIWSFDGLGRWASTSAPMIDATGRVVAADDQSVVMLSQNGTLMWQVPLPGGFSISPVVTDNDLIIVTTTAGMIVSIDPLTGKKSGETQLMDTIGGKFGFFATRNTPCVNGNRVYSINEFFPFDGSEDETRTGRLFAIDVNVPEAGLPFEIGWTLDFGARSGGSPTIVDGFVFFDGDFPDPISGEFEETNPHIFGVEDLGSRGQFLFKLPIDREVRGSPSSDPYGRGIWFSSMGPLWSLVSSGGIVLDTIDVNEYPVIASNAKAGIATFGWRENGNAVGMFPTGWFTGEGPLGAFGSHFYQIGIDIVTKELVFSTFLGNELVSWSSSQSATVTDARGKPVIIIVTSALGVFAIGQKYDQSDNGTAPVIRNATARIPS